MVCEKGVLFSIDERGLVEVGGVRTIGTFGEPTTVG